MTELKKIETGMVPVYETSTGEKVVYGTELHEVLEISTPYRDWSKRRFRDIDAIENEDYEPAQICAPSGQNKKEHIIKLDIAKEMAMLERNEKGKQVRRYFIQVEKKYKAASEIAADHMGRILEMLEMQSQKINELENRLENGATHCRNPFTLADFSGKKGKLDGLINEVARLCKLDKSKVLHYLYRTVEENLKVSVDGVKSFYKMEIGNEISTFETVIQNNQLYTEALRLCEETIERKRTFG